MLDVATTQWSRPQQLSKIGALLPLAGGEATKGTATPVPKAAALTSILSKTLAMVCANFLSSTPTSSQVCFTFQRIMYRTCAGLEGAFPYIDDSQIASVDIADKETHLQHLDKFFAALAANGLVINKEKCVFAVPTLEFLGHKISATGLAPAADHAAEIKNCVVLPTKFFTRR
jgi:hypothetical protein